MDIIEFFNQNKQIADWQKNLNKSTRQLLMGLSSSSKAITMASCVEENHKILILTSSYSEAEKLSSDLIELLGEEKVYTFLADDTPLAEFVFSSQEKIFARLEALDFFWISPATSGISDDPSTTAISLGPKSISPKASFKTGQSQK